MKGLENALIVGNAKYEELAARATAQASKHLPTYLRQYVYPAEQLMQKRPMKPFENSVSPSVLMRIRSKIKKQIRKT